MGAPPTPALCSGQRSPRWVTQDTASNSVLPLRVACESQAATSASDSDSSDTQSLQTLQDRYAAVTSAGVSEARLVRGLRREDMRLQRDPQRVKIEEKQEKEDSSSTAGGSSTPRLTPVSLANAQRIQRDEKEAKSS